MIGVWAGAWCGTADTQTRRSDQRKLLAVGDTHHYCVVCTGHTAMLGSDVNVRDASLLISEASPPAKLMKKRRTRWCRACGSVLLAAVVLAAHFALPLLRLDGEDVGRIFYYLQPRRVLDV